MRKIKSMADIERVRRRNNIILGVVMIALLVGSTAGYSLMSADSEDENVVEERGFKFVRDGGMWKLGLDEGKFFSFQYLPSEVDEVDVNVSVEFGNYPGQPLYFVNPSEGAGEILNVLGEYLLRYQEACLDSGYEENSTNETVCEGDLPVKDCNSNLIIFEAGNETRVYGEENCVFIEGDFIRGVDAFLYKILGV
ncbi:hypothetical protein K8R30_00420 [archaeon]|nr:hypothetical protein [archaeon]